MHKKIAFLWVLVVLSATVYSQNQNAELYQIEIIQDSDTFKLGESPSIVTLKRSPFRFRFLLEESRYVYFIASKSDKYYKTKPGRPFPTCLMFCGGAVGADNMFNPEKDICVYDFAQGISCWYYDSATEHRFDGDATPAANGIYTERTIENIYDYAAKSTTSVKKLKKESSFYVVFSDIDNEPCDECDSHTEVTPWRRSVKLIFE